VRLCHIASGACHAGCVSPSRQLHRPHGEEHGEFVTGAVLAPVDLREPKPPTTQPNVALAAQGAKATASSVWSPEYTPDKVIDGNAETRWNSARGDVAGSWLAVDFGKPRTISTIRFTEAAGGRITSYKLQTWDGTQWRDLVTAPKPAERTRVRHRFSPVATSRIRLLVTAAAAVPTIYELEAK
jgi:hypothetical protein